MDISEIGYRVAINYIPFLFALTFHEFAHGWVAKRLGDRSAEWEGRLTLNPIAHMDLLGTFLFPLTSIVFHSPIFFGWAKPVPVDYRHLKNLRTDLFWIAIAGPLSNFLLAILATGAVALSVHLLGASPYLKTLVLVLNSFILTNLFLGFFNFIPVHPLDGGKVLARFIPLKWNIFLEANQGVISMVLLFLMVTRILDLLSLPVSWVHQQLMQLAFLGAM